MVTATADAQRFANDSGNHVQLVSRRANGHRVQPWTEQPVSRLHGALMGLALRSWLRIDLVRASANAAPKLVSFWSPKEPKVAEAAERLRREAGKD